MAMIFAMSAAAAGEFVILKTGYRLYAVSHEEQGSRTRVYTPGGGQLNLSSSAIARFEPDGVAEPVASVASEKPIVHKPLSVDAAVARFAAEVELPPELIHAVIAEESAYRIDAVSEKGAVGLMQLTPRTAAELAVDPHNPIENLRGGIHYLKQLLERYEGKDDQIVRALAAYNAGPGRVDQYDGVPPYAETRAYVRRVIERFIELTE